jgi:hypothetical protein
VLRPCQYEKLARGAQDTENAMSQKLNPAIAVIGIDIGKNSFLLADGRLRSDVEVHDSQHRPSAFYPG